MAAIFGVPLPVVGLMALLAAIVGSIGYLSLPAPDEPPQLTEPRSHVEIVDPPPFDWSDYDDL